MWASVVCHALRRQRPWLLLCLTLQVTIKEPEKVETVSGLGLKTHYVTYTDSPPPAQDPPPTAKGPLPPPPPPAQDQPHAQPPPGPVPRPLGPPWGRWLDRDTNPCLNSQHIGEGMQRPLELCNYDGLEALPPIGKEYEQGYKRVNDRLPKGRQRLHRAAEHRRGIDGRAHNNA
ncbi:hypothetical protein QJQ45_001924 [Haematococcus lacustris]|nr:hypothetical protein QJQ45_001924 [Haematococcus lacustris]